MAILIGVTVTAEAAQPKRILLLHSYGGLFDLAAGGVVPALLTVILAVAGVSWQYSNIAMWIKMLPMGRNVSLTPGTDGLGVGTLVSEPMSKPRLMASC